MTLSNYQIGYGALRVDARFAITLKENDEEGDRRCWIKAAPALNGGPGYVGVYLATNGDPVQIATLDGEGDVVWYLGEDGPEETEEVTIASALDTFHDFTGCTPEECAEKCADLFAALTD